ncbi:MAG: DUF448 domain-containing protein [Sphingopyxis sp.]|nr:DUF448 domain-containing protein [Sphingopyxis sp.]
MRNPPNDPPEVVGEPDARPPRVRGKHVPERRCILTGECVPAERLLRLALSPDGEVLPDVLAKAPGRGAWIAVDRAALETAVAKGKLKGALARAFKTSDIAIPADLGERVAAALQRVTLDRLGLESRGGYLITGNERIETAARGGTVALLLHASDAAPDGRNKLAQAWRVGSDREGSGIAGTILPVDRVTLSVALGRENAVHMALIDARAAARVQTLLARWQFYLGWARDAANGDPASKTGADTAVSAD